MDTVNTTAPSIVEIDAAEKVLAEAHGHPVDGYWRDIGRSVLEAARDARLAEFIAITEREFDRALGEGRR
jgi:hypothetical protein